MRQPDHTLTVNGEKWRVFVGPIPKRFKASRDVGVTDHDTKTFYVKNESHFRTTLRHEYFHARFPDMTETAIRELELETLAVDVIALKREADS